MNMKKFIAGIASAVVAASAAMAVSVSAAEVDIPYSGPSEGAYKNESNEARVNIFNVWTTPQISDIDGDHTAVNEYIDVTFTISGLGDQVTNLDDMGNATDSYIAYLCGQVGTDGGRHGLSAIEAAGDTPVDITGDGQYTARYHLAEGSESISCLYIQTNINLWNRAGFDGNDPASTGINITVDSIKTDDGVVAEDPTEAPTTAAPAADDKTTTAKPGASDSKTTTTAKADDKKTTTTAKKGETAAATGDAGIVTAVAALGVAAACAFVVRKRK
ncbi:MAG: hypothetical protein NC093_06675 [Alistipes sp.]|nr:hypothetical protein [Alistipes sp.]